jgi:hypothetical protein
MEQRDSRLPTAHFLLAALRLKNFAHIHLFTFPLLLSYRLAEDSFIYPGLLLMCQARKWYAVYVCYQLQGYCHLAQVCGVCAVAIRAWLPFMALTPVG